MNSSEADIGAGIIITSFSALGLAFNGVGLMMVWSNSSLSKSFGQLCINSCLSNVIICILYILWVAPVTFIQADTLSASLLGKFLGAMMNYFWCVFLFSHVTISIDRLISICFPLQAKLSLSQINCKLITAAIWLFAVVNIVPFFWFRKCYFVYKPATWRWSYGKEGTSCSHFLSQFNMWKTIAGIGIMAILDLITMFCLHRHHRYTRRMTVTSRTDLEGVDERCRRIEVKFFAQTVLQGLMLVCHQVMLHVVQPHAHAQWLLFICTTLTIILTHTLDGLILCIFHLKGFKKQRRPSMLSVKTTVTLT